jgi:hypothetical protein
VFVDCPVLEHGWVGDEPDRVITGFPRLVSAKVAQRQAPALCIWSNGNAVQRIALTGDKNEYQ